MRGMAAQTQLGARRHPERDAKTLTRDEARIAINIAKLPQFLLGF
jgi:hypothetical protein